MPATNLQGVTAHRIGATCAATAGALTLLAAGMSVYRVAAVMDLPFDVVHRWSVDARRAAEESTAA